MLCQIHQEGSMGWNINFSPCITLQGKEERSHPHEGAGQCCSPSPSELLQRAVFSSSQGLSGAHCEKNLQGKHQTTHLLQVGSLISSLLLLPQWGVHQNCHTPGKNRITKSNCHCPPDSLKFFRLHFFSFFRRVSHGHFICILSDCGMHRMATDKWLHSSSLSSHHTLPLRSTSLPVHEFLLLLAPKPICLLSSVPVTSLCWPPTLLPGSLPYDSLIPVICMFSPLSD